jgi:hemerythrin-like domain-containing protein
MTTSPARPMTMNRVIHGAVRRDLARLDAALGEFRDGDRARAGDLNRSFEYLRSELTRHHEGEDRHIWPMLGTLGVDADLLATMESEHSAMAQSLGETEQAMRAFAASGSAADAEAARASLTRTREVTERHLDHEEKDLEPQMAPHMESPEWKATEKQLRKAPPAVAGSFFAWLTDGMDDAERSYLRSTVPTPVVFVLSRLLGRRYLREVAPVWRAR